MLQTARQAYLGAHVHLKMTVKSKHLKCITDIKSNIDMPVGQPAAGHNFRYDIS